MPEERITKAQRWLDLIACLLGRRRPMTVEQIFEAVPAYRLDAGPDGDPKAESVRRKFERDKDELRDLGIPIDTESFTVGYGSELAEGYRLRPGALYLPIVRILEASATAPPDSGSGRGSVDEAGFSRDDLETVLEALREASEIPGSPLAEATHSAYEKLAFDLDSIPEPHGVVRASAPGASEVGGVLGRLSEGLLRRKRVAFRYHGLGRDAATDRDVAAYGLLMENGAWYLVGHDRLRDAIRMFHAGRIEDPRVNPRSPSTPDYEIPGDFDLSAHRGLDAWELGDEDAEVTVRVRFEHPLQRWAERNGYGELESEEPGRGAIRVFRVRHVRPFLGWLLGLEGRAHVVEPADLRQELRGLAEQIESGHA